MKRPKLSGKLLFTTIWLAMTWSLFAGEAGLRFLAEVIEAPVLKSPSSTPYPDMISEMRVRTEPGEEWIIHSWVMRDRNPEDFARLQEGCVIGIHGVAWNDQDEKIRSQYCSNSSIDFETERLWAVSWTLHPDCKVGLKEEAQENVVGAGEPLNLSMIRKVLAQRGGSAIQATDDPQAFYLSSSRIYEDEFWKPSERSAAVGGVSPLDAITSFRDRLKAQGTELLVLIVPRKESLIPGYVTRIPYSMEDGRANSAVIQFGAELAKSGVHTINLTEPFLEQRNYELDGEQLFLYEVAGTHWSSYGAHLAAAHLRGKIEAMGMGRLLEPASVQAERMLPPRVGPERISDPVRPGTFADPSSFEVKTSYYQAVEGYPRPVQDTPCEVYLIGDSFAGHKQERGRSLRAHLDTHLKLPLRTISSPGQAATTVRSLWLSDENRAEAKLVIWEITECFLGKEDDWMPVRDAMQEGAVDLISDWAPTEIKHGEIGEVDLNQVKSQGITFGGNMQDRRLDLGSVTWKSVSIPKEVRRVTLLCGGVRTMERGAELWVRLAPFVEFYVDGVPIGTKRCPCHWTTFVHFELPKQMNDTVDLEVRVRSHSPDLAIDQVCISEIILAP